jgi:hypothetical protein
MNLKIFYYNFRIEKIMPPPSHSAYNAAKALSEASMSKYHDYDDRTAPLEFASMLPNIEKDYNEAVKRISSGGYVTLYWGGQFPPLFLEIIQMDPSWG